MDIEASQKLQDFRKILKDNSVQAYVVPHGDAHDSEYIAAADERIAFISGFTGSAGFAMVSLEEAYLWTDGRYFLQADKQLEKGWELKKQVKGFQPWFNFISQKYGEGYAVGYDPMLMTAADINKISKIFTPKNISLKPISQNLVDSLWQGKPAEPNSQIIEHEYKWHEYKFEDKLQKVKEIVEKQKGQLYLTSRLDEIAWALNLRGSDINFNPVFKSYLILNISNSTSNINGTGVLYVDSSKVSEPIQKYLESIKVLVKPYTQVFEDLQKFSTSEKVAFGLPEINRRLYESIQESNRVEVSLPSPICILKAVKSEKEQQGFRECNVRDGSALVSYLAWLEDELVNKNNTEITEYTAANELEQRRRALELNVGLSFDTISSIGPNGAVIHYKPEQDTALKLNPDLVYLVDSGGQYYDGTTDVTRTLHFKTPTAEQKENYTRVLMGNLDVQTLIWPVTSQISGSHIDSMARKYLWNKKLDFAHGTGHGVGHFLNVHEGPQGISRLRTQVLLKGMTMTDEPGFYKNGEYGIRIEDDLLVVDKGDDFLGFENLTLCPYDQNLIEVSLLNRDHIDTINQYHEKVYAKLSPFLEKNNNQLALDWLKKHTKKISV